MAYTQDDRIIGVETPLGPDVLLLQSFSGVEGVSRLFHLELRLASEETSIPFQDVVGKRFDVRISLRDEQERHINGIVSRFAQTGRDQRFAYYRADLHPWLWFLTRNVKCRIFQDMSVTDIVAKVFGDLGFSDFRDDTTATYEPRDYCVQYRESDFNFVSRLMEQYGIFYFFEHEQGKHTLVLGDSPSAHPACPHQESARYFFSEGALEDEDVVHVLELEQELRPGKYTLTDYNFKTPSTGLEASAASIVDVGGNTAYEVYDYPGEYGMLAQGEDLSRLRMEEEEATHLVVKGSSTCRDFSAGHKFALEEHFRDDLNTDLLLLEVRHVADGGEFGTDADRGGARATYVNHFTCIPHATPYRPLRQTPRPVVQGPQTAVVVGPSGEKIYVDKYGRVKVQFHWDREGKKNENSSCWMRVSQNWAGADWGGMFIPHIGQEVIVSFLEGDPDQPIITGRVYNAERMPPLGLPGNMTKSAIRDHGGNEIVMEGEEGSQRITLYSPHAETKFNLGAPNSPDPGAWLETKAHWVAQVAQNQIEKIGGESQKEVQGPLKLIVGGETYQWFKGAVQAKWDGIYARVHGGVVSDNFLGAKHGSVVGFDLKTNYSIEKSVNGGKVIKNASKPIDFDSEARIQLTGGGGNASVLKLDGGKAAINSGSSSIVIDKDGTIHITSNADVHISASGDIKFAKLVKLNGGTMTLTSCKIDHKNLTVSKA